ncbi:hypothetical protein BU197_00085 [Streptomyces sp. CBMA291]|nr:hypothetical protein [Streptomyces sp. CBMA291]MBD0715008.1 hypothetical protein [Streptomyces sp. CBMA370]
MWNTIVVLRPVVGLDDEDVPMSARVVGAAGHARADALLRGAGEAVERAALHPSNALPAVRGRAAELSAPTLPWHGPEMALAAPQAAEAVLDWLPARRLSDDSPVLVPTGLIDFPYTDTDTAAWFDAGPSCAASGSSPSMALRSALLEMVERDAMLVAWECGLRLPSWTDLSAATLPPCEAAERMAKKALSALWGKARDEGIEPCLARIPTAVPGLWCVVGSLIDPAERPGALASVGLKVSDRPWAALLGAFQEAWQVRACLKAEQERSSGDAPPAPHGIASEPDRIRYMVSPAGVSSLREWVAAFVPAGPQPDPVRVPDETVLAAVLADGADPVAVDLTARLPEPLRAMGWQAVKVVPAGYQHLRMDERHQWSRNAFRLATAEARTGCEAMYPEGSPHRPHPLP